MTVTVAPGALAWGLLPAPQALRTEMLLWMRFSSAPLRIRHLRPGTYAVVLPFTTYWVSRP